MPFLSRPNYKYLFITSSSIAILAFAYQYYQPSQSQTAAPYTPIHMPKEPYSELILPQHPSRHFLNRKEGLEEAFQKVISEHEKTFATKELPEYKVDFNWISSNPKMEDTFSINTLSFDNRTTGLLVSVHDGHSGGNCSRHLAHYVPRYVQQQLNLLLKQQPNQENILKIMKEALLKVDNDALEAALKFPSDKSLGAALHGSVSLTALLLKNYLYVAATGDVEGVLGVLDSDSNQYKVQPLCEPHVYENEKERQRIQSKHPNEENIFYNRRLLGGLMPFRAFGDAKYKWTQKDLDLLSERWVQYLNGKGSALWQKQQLEQFKRAMRMPELSKTPPYLTAEPEMKVYELPKEGKDKKDIPQVVLILASDGFWDIATHQEALQWAFEFYKNKKAIKHEKISTFLLEKAFSKVPPELKDMTSTQYTSELFALPSNISRRYRDDVTVLVVVKDDNRLKVDEEIEDIKEAKVDGEWKQYCEAIYKQSLTQKSSKL